MSDLPGNTAELLFRGIIAALWRKLCFWRG